MANAAVEFFEKHKADMAKMQKEMPDVVTGFGALFGKLMKDGALTTREKELVALGLAVALRCVPCINLHIEKCIGMGITREQVLEAASVVVMMQGGPGFTYMPVVMDALDALKK